MPEKIFKIGDKVHAFINPTYIEGWGDSEEGNFECIYVSCTHFFSTVRNNGKTLFTNRDDALNHAKAFFEDQKRLRQHQLKNIESTLEHLFKQ
jgi:hypothetical protein